MMCPVLLLLLAVGLAAAQQEFVMYTNGRGGGEICGRHHLCVSYADCKPEVINGQHLKMCVCRDLSEGNGKIACHYPQDYVLYIQEDPHLRNFFQPKEFLGLPSPCRYRLAHLVMVPSIDTTAVIELFGENLLFKGGKYFLTKLTLSTNIVLAGDMMKQTMQFFGDVSETGNYTLVARSIEAEGIAIGEEGSVFNIGEGTFMDYTMKVGKDEVNNLLKVTIKNLGITLLFRPPSIREGLDNTLLPMVPGGAFIVDHKHWEDVIIERSDLELSSWPEGPSLKSVAKDMDIPKPLLVQYLMLNNSLSDPIYNDEVCVETNRIFRDVCAEEHRLAMLRLCKPIYTDEEFLRILSDQGIIDKYMVLLKTFFQRCESAYCLHNVETCQKLKTDMEEEFKDRPPKFVEDLNCELFRK